MSFRGISSAISRSLLAALALCCLALALPGLASAATGAISGTVKSSALPVAGVEVCAESSSGEFGCDETAVDGTYLIAGLEPGSYTVEFWAGSAGLNLRTQFWDHVDRFGEATPVTVTSEATHEGIDAELKAGGTIVGTVVAHRNGTPLAGVEVCAFLAGGFIDNCTNTKSNGTYEMSALTPGSHVVVFEAAGYLPQAYAGKNPGEEPTPVVVTEGGVSAGVNAALVIPGQIKGHIYQANGSTPVAQAVACAVIPTSGKLFECAESNGTGAYTIDSLNPGAYKVVFSPEFSEFGFPTPGPGQFGAPDVWPTQFYNLKTTLADAAVLNLPPDMAAVNVNARLGYVAAPPATNPAPPVIVPVTQPAKPKPKLPHCRKGKRKAKKHGKTVCVRVHRKHHQKHKGKHHRAIH